MTTMADEEYQTTRVTSNWRGRMAFAHRPDVHLHQLLNYALWMLWVLAPLLAFVALFW
jgi:hypothetical protein